ncbi:glycoside hydrolase family 3 protein [Leifsonia poae]|uniref:glycoside hydrolase family 3 protein n=1 Tax=Leifsonia poae TaxID=110933 RepID=UPI001CBBC31A|nr:glycoside hydrolase family 3 N-terminal domain-containing protein [Leifsonia poae]
MSTPAYLNPALSADERVDDLLPRMTIEEKAGLLFHPATSLAEPGYSADQALADAQRDISDKLISHFNVFNGADAAEIADWTNQLQQLAAETRLGIPVTISSDPRNGFRSTPFTGHTLDSLSRWPEHTGLAAIGDVDLVREYGDTIRREFLAMGIRVYLGPMADLYTEPRWSRGFGTFGEDVDLVSSLTAAFIEGLRSTADLGSESVAAVVKHFPGGGPQLDGFDAHDKRHREQVYPGGQQKLHLRPFEAAFAAGVSQVMPYYGMPVGTEWEERGFAFNAPVIRDLLRGHYAFNGIVVSDWNLLESADVAGIVFGPNGYGLEDLSPTERLEVGLTVGVDQFGGDNCPERVVELVRSGRVSEERIDQSVRRILREKFVLGLFEDRYADIEAARAVGADASLRALGTEAQAKSLTLLADADVLPVRPGARVFAEGIDWATVEHELTVVTTPEEADLNIVRLDAPWQPDPESALGDWFHGGRIDFSEDIVAHLGELAKHAPTIGVIYLERPAVLTELLPSLSALVVEFGASDQVVIDALQGATPFTGRLPFDLPSSMAAIEQSREDVPFDTAAPAFTHGAGIQRAALVANPIAHRR